MFHLGQRHLFKSALVQRKLIAKRISIRSFSVTGTLSSKSGDGHDQWNALFMTVAIAACAAMTAKSNNSSLALSDSAAVKCDASTTVIAPASEAATLGNSKKMNPNDKPRNVMLHRLRSIKARSLQDKYDINWDVVLGEGAYGAVYPGKLRSTGEKVALKRISKRFTDQSSFRRETEALLRVYDNGGHPNISGLRDIYEDYSHYYLVLDLICGGEMFDHLINDGPFSEADAARLIRETASALTFLHGIGVLHADLKPENLMLCSTKRDQGTIKVVDFGCARVLHDNFHDEVYTPEQSVGTTAYWPPERFVKASEATPAMDMWSTGIILYIMLVGIHPFDPEGCATDEEIEKRIKANPKPPIGAPYTSHLSASAIDLIKKLMEPDPNKRLSAATMLEHPWVMGETANTWKMVGSDAKLAKFKEMRNKLETSIFAVLLEQSARDLNISEKKIESPIKAHDGSLMKKAFELFDAEGKGSVSVDDLSRVVTKYTGVEVSKDEAQEYLDQQSSPVLGLSDFTDLFTKLRSVQFPKGHVIFKAGDAGDCMYFINSGKVEIYTRKGHVISILRNGDFFGEGSLLQASDERFASARALTPVDAIKITREDFERYTSAKGIKIPLKMKFKARQLESAKNLIRLQSSVNARWFKRGDVVYHEGEIGDSIFFVDDNIGGVFEAKHGGHKVHVYQGGETFGVTSLLLKRPHSSTVICASDKCLAHEMRGSDFLEVVKHNPDLVESLRDMCRKRMFKKAIKKLALDMKLGLTFKDVEAAFNEADKDKSGSLSLDELRFLFRRMDPDFPEEDIVAFLQYIDLDEDGRIGFDEFKLLFRCSDESGNSYHVKT